MWTCPECGKKLEDWYKKCIYCGDIGPSHNTPNDVAPEPEQSILTKTKVVDLSVEDPDTMVKNAVGSILRGVGIAEFVIGAIAALGSLANDNPVLCGIILASAFISGMMFLGFAEIITLLQKIVNKQ